MAAQQDTLANELKAVHPFDYGVAYNHTYCRLRQASQSCARITSSYNLKTGLTDFADQLLRHSVVYGATFNEKHFGLPIFHHFLRNQTLPARRILMSSACEPLEN